MFEILSERVRWFQLIWFQLIDGEFIAIDAAKKLDVLHAGMATGDFEAYLAAGRQQTGEERT